MRHILLLTFLLAIGQTGISQDSGIQEGTVSYKSSQNVYVKFNNTAGIEPGDTLYLLKDDKRIPGIVVQHTSSLSVMGTLIEGIEVAVDATVIHETRKQIELKKDEPPKNTDLPPAPVPVPDPISPESDEVAEPSDRRAQSIRGKVSVSMYQHSYGEVASNRQRFRYIFSLQTRNLGGSRLSTDTYISYRHQFEDWEEDNQNLATAFRVYSLALTYDFTDRTRVVLGRKVNTNIANIGAVDGIQAEHSFGKFTLGGFAGSRPDNIDYGFNFDLLQYGGFAAYRTPVKHGSVQSSLAMVEQKNNGVTDRRFAYLQHSSNLTRTLSLFASAEFDLYSRVDSITDNAIHFTSTYVSFQFRPTRSLSFNASYDARMNVIYYETYKNFIDNLIEEEMRQGLRFRGNWRMMKYVSLGASVGYRFQKDQGSNATNYHIYLSHSRLPWINVSARATAIFLRNDYLSGAVYGIKLSRDIIKQKVYGEVEYRLVNYQYGNSELELHQDIFGAAVSWRVLKKLSVSLDYEGVFADQPNNRFHLNIVQRF